MDKYTSDLHLGHKNIIKMSRTGFTSIEEMDDYIIKQWNEHVDADDDVWICGDFSYRAELGADHYLKQMKGRKHLIIGNHDTMWMQNCKLEKYFESVSHMEILKRDKKTFTLCHYPLMEWTGSRYAKHSLEGSTWLIHGHIHASRTNDAYKYILDKLPCALNCTVDVNDYRPVSFEELLKNNDRFYGRTDIDWPSVDSR
ncbi:MAG: metallophosphoesterase family protein [Lachnospiraceae bacterium]|nr:metallophosphoesterase family protein [Lachnospiraceae bacterium]